MPERTRRFPPLRIVDIRSDYRLMESWRWVFPSLEPKIACCPLPAALRDVRRVSMPWLWMLRTTSRTIEGWRR
jgi:hypothetical protein